MTSPVFIVPRPPGARDDGKRYVAAVTRNADCVFTIRAIDPDTQQPVDWDCDVWVFVDIGSGREQAKVVAVVSGPDAQVCIESETADKVKTGGAWQAIRSRDGQPFTREGALLVGSFERADGGVPRE